MSPTPNDEPLLSVRSVDTIAVVKLIVGTEPRDTGTAHRHDHANVHSVVDAIGGAHDGPIDHDLNRGRVSVDLVAEPVGGGSLEIRQRLPAHRLKSCVLKGRADVQLAPARRERTFGKHRPETRAAPDRHAEVESKIHVNPPAEDPMGNVVVSPSNNPYSAELEFSVRAPVVPRGLVEQNRPKRVAGALCASVSRGQQHAQHQESPDAGHVVSRSINAQSHEREHAPNPPLTCTQ